MIRLVKWAVGDLVDATGELIEIGLEAGSRMRFVGLILRPNGSFVQYEMVDLVVTDEFETRQDLELSRLSKDDPFDRPVPVPEPPGPIIPTPPAPTSPPLKPSKSLLDRK